MSVPKFDTFLKTILHYMKNGASYKRSTIVEIIIKEAIARSLLVKEDLEEKISSGESKVVNRIGWAFTFLTKAEYIKKSDSEKFCYHITDLGIKALDDVEQNNKVMNEKYLKDNAPNYNKNWNIKIKDDKNLDQNDEETEQDFDLEVAIDEIREKVESEFIVKIRQVNWQYFEDFCAVLIEKMNYGVASKREIRVRDGGIDGIIYTDELGIKDKIYIQAKRYSDNNTVTAKDVKEFLYNITESKAKGIFITTSKFSGDALKAAEKFQNGQIALIDDKKFIQLCRKYKHGFRVKTNVEILEVDDDLFETN
jgi:restriction system protein